jgi:hypothetical protein
VYFLFPLLSLIPIVLVIAGQLPTPEQGLGLIDHSLSLGLAGAQMSGAVLLWKLRRSAVYLFMVALVLCVVNFWWHILIRNWFSAMTTIDPSLAGPMLVVVIVSQVLLAGVCVYTWRLAKRGVLR